MSTRSFSGPVRAGCLLVLAGGGAALLGGCGRPVGSVTGKVQYQSQPLKGGGLVFYSTEGRESFATTIAENGTYTLDAITAGTYKVCVDTSFLKGPSDSGLGRRGGPGKGGKGSPGKAAKEKEPKEQVPITALPEGYVASNPAEMAAAQALKRYVQIPEKYAARDTTDLEVIISGEKGQTYEIVLK